MRKKLIILAMILCNTMIFAQDNDNPYAMFGYEPKISDVTYYETELFYLHNTDTTILVQTLAFDFENGKVYLYGTNNQSLATLLLDKEIMARFTSIDPMAEKYYSTSPYAYCLNNPMKYIDPNGMNVYRYDDKTGDMILFQKNDDKFDQIGQFKTVKDKETGEKSYELKTKKDGTAETRIDNIEKGILSDGINFKTNDNVINVGGEGQATKGGFENFILNFSNMIDKEIGGYYLSNKNSNDISYIYVSKFKNNSPQEANVSFNLYSMRPDLLGNIDVKVGFHTHLSRFDDSYRLKPSSLGPNGGDMGQKERQLKTNPLLQFLIITNPKPFDY